MSKRAAAVMRSQAKNIKRARKQLLTLPFWQGEYACVPTGLQDLCLLLAKIAEALEHAADEELEAGKRWWKDQEAQRISQIKAEMAEVQRKIASPRQEPWL